VKLAYNSNSQFNIPTLKTKHFNDYSYAMTLTVESHDDDTSKFSCIDNWDTASSCASEVFIVLPYSKLYTYLPTTQQNNILKN